MIVEASALARQAVAADEAGSAKEALELYQRALEKFVSALEDTDSPPARKVIQERIDAYLARAEQLRSRDAPGPGAPAVAWDDIAGLDEAKEHLYEAVVMPAQQPGLFATGGAWRAVLLYG